MNHHNHHHHQNKVVTIVQKHQTMSEAITKIIDELVSKDVSVMYTFDHLEIDVPQARGPGGKELGGAKWVIDGKITITYNLSHRCNQQRGTNWF